MQPGEARRFGGRAFKAFLGPGDSVCQGRSSAQGRVKDAGGGAWGQAVAWWGSSSLEGTWHPSTTGTA